jgi:hypothetical protein
MGEVAAADEFSDSFEKPLAKGGKSVYSEHRMFRFVPPETEDFFSQKNNNEMSTF